MKRAQVNDVCPIEPAVELLFGRWTSHVLWELSHHGRMRFGELAASVPGVTPRVLTERLRQLERDGLVQRTYHREVPPRVEYEATALAETLTPIFRELAEWSTQHAQEVQKAQRRYDTGRFGDAAVVPEAGRAVRA